MMIMKSVHKRIDNTSLSTLLGLVVVLLIGCIVVTINKITNVFKSK